MSSSESDYQPSAAQVKALRDATDLPMMECKKALVQAKGDHDLAIKILREQGEKVAGKKVGRETTQGRVEAFVEPDGKVIGMVQMKCEQAPSAKNERFIAMTKALAKQAALQPAEPTAENILEAADVDEPTKKAGARLLDVVNLIRENMGVARVARVRGDGGVLGLYVHFNFQEAAIVRLEGAGATPELATELAMHVVATKPIAIRREDVAQDVVERERDIAKTQAAQTGKPANIVEKIAEGKVNAFFSENVLIEQISVKDNKTKVRDLLGKASVTHMVRFRVGE